MRTSAYLVLLATLLLWSGNWIVARAVRDDIGPGIATAGRLVIALLVLLPFVFTGLISKLKDLNRKDWLILAALGLSGGGPHLGLQWLGLHYTTVTSAVLYLSTAPVFILLLARTLLGETIGPRQWAGVAISFLGAFFLATQGRFEALSFNLGDLLSLASMAMWGTYTVFLRMRRDSLGIGQLLVVVCLFGLVFMSPWVLYEWVQGMTLRLSPAGAFAVLYSAIGSLLLAFAGWSYVVTRLGAARAAVTMHLIPAMAVILAAIFLDEVPRWFHFAGIALILAGVGLSVRRSS